MARPDTAVYFTNVLVQSPTRAILCGHLYLEKAEPTVTRVYLCDDGDWFSLYDIEGIVYATAARPAASGRRTVCFLSRDGLFRENVSGKKPKDTRIELHEVSTWMDLRLIDNTLYACGVQNQVMRRSGTRWVAIDDGIAVPLEDEVTTSLESIDGFHEHDVYAAGSDGIWHWNGKRWSLVWKTALPLFAIQCASDGQVYAAGSGGTLWIGRGTGWTDRSDTSVCDEVYEGIVEFQGVVYLAATKQLVAVHGAKLVDVTPRIRGRKTFSALDADATSMWAVGDQSVLRFDGHEWRRYQCPDNQ